MKTIIFAISSALFLCSLVAQPSVIFEDDFENGVLDLSYWSPFPDMIGDDGVVDVQNGVGQYT